MAKKKKKTPAKKRSVKAAKAKKPAKKTKTKAKARAAKKTKVGKKAKPAKKTKAVKKPVKKTAAKKAVAAKKPAKKTKAAKPKTREVLGEGNYSASRRFRKEQTDFVTRNKAKIADMGKAAEAALEGAEGNDLRAAEAEASAHAHMPDVT